MHDLGFWFPFVGLFLPRFTLFFWWLFGQLPFNTVPTFFEFFGAIFIPRIIIIVYIFTLQGFSVWFFVHALVLLLVWSLSALGLVKASK